MSKQRPGVGGGGARSARAAIVLATCAAWTVAVLGCDEVPSPPLDLRDAGVSGAGPDAGDAGAPTDADAPTAELGGWIYTQPARPRGDLLPVITATDTVAYATNGRVVWSIRRGVWTVIDALPELAALGEGRILDMTMVRGGDLLFLDAGGVLRLDSEGEATRLYEARGARRLTALDASEVFVAKSTGVWRVTAEGEALVVRAEELGHDPESCASDVPRPHQDLELSGETLFYLTGCRGTGLFEVPASGGDAEETLTLEELRGRYASRIESAGFGALAGAPGGALLNLGGMMVYKRSGGGWSTVGIAPDLVDDPRGLDFDGAPIDVSTRGAIWALVDGAIVVIH